MTATEDRTWQGQRAREARELAVKLEVAEAHGPLVELMRECLADTNDPSLAVLLLAARLDLHTGPAIDPPHPRPVPLQVLDRIPTSWDEQAQVDRHLPADTIHDLTRIEEITADRSKVTRR